MGWETDKREVGFAIALFVFEAVLILAMAFIEGFPSAQ